MNGVWLIEREIYETKMSQARFQTAAAIARRCGSFLITGNGWPGYDSSLSVAANLEALDARPDFVIFYKPEKHRGSAEYDGAVKVVRYNEAWWPDRRASKEAEAAGVDLVVLHHENDRRMFPDDPAYDVVHIPHCVDASVYSPRGVDWSRNRTTDCLVAGVLSDEIYPLRGRWAALVRSKAIPGRVRLHPGYRLQGRQSIESQVRDYAMDLWSSKVLLTCSSIYRYALAKYVEAMAAGCIVIGDMPDDSRFRGTLGKLMVEVDPSWPDERLVDAVRSVLARDDLEEWSSACALYAGAGYSADRYALEFEQSVARRILRKR